MHSSNPKDFKLAHGKQIRAFIFPLLTSPKNPKYNHHPYYHIIIFKVFQSGNFQEQNKPIYSVSSLNFQFNH